MGRKHMKPVVDVVPGYTEKQSRIIRGETPHNMVNGRLAYQFLKRATALNDEPNIKLAQHLLDVAKNVAYRKNLERSRQRSRKVLHNEDIVWRQPKSTEYTDHQKQIVRGEIPLDKVHTNELISIHQKAKAVGDIELAERILNLIIDRRNITREARIERFNRLHENRKDTSGDYGDGYKKRKYLTKWERDVLDLNVDLDECPLEHMQHILSVCEMNNDRDIDIARQLLQYKEHPECVYVTHDLETAINDIERMIGKPLRRPSTWFTA